MALEDSWILHLISEVYRMYVMYESTNVLGGVGPGVAKGERKK